MFTYLFLRERDTHRERERESTSWGETEKERETQNVKQPSGSELSAISAEPNSGLELMNREIIT